MLTRYFESEMRRGYGITGNAYELLARLDNVGADGERMTVLAGQLLLTTGGFTHLADRLCREGLIERRRAVGDQRGMVAVLTAKGREMIAAARTEHLEGVRRLFLGHLDQQEMEVLAGLWARIRERSGLVDGSANALP